MVYLSKLAKELFDGKLTSTSFMYLILEVVTGLCSKIEEVNVVSVNHEFRFSMVLAIGEPAIKLSLQHVAMIFIRS